MWSHIEEEPGPPLKANVIGRRALASFLTYAT